MSLEKILIISALPVACIAICVSIFSLIRVVKRNKQVKVPEPVRVPLSFEQCEEILTVIIDDIYKNKYFLQYILRELTVIPKMDDEIQKITKDIYSAMSPYLIYSYRTYYTESYLISMITRRVQMLLVEYTNTYKPNVK